MVQKVTLPDGSVHNFPDEATPEQMQGAVDSIMAEQKQQKMDKFNYVTGANRTLMDLPVDLAQGAVKGLGYGGAALGNLPSLSKGTYIEDTKNSMRDVDKLAGFLDPVRDLGLRKNPKDKESLAGDIAQGIGKYLPYGMGAGALTEAVAGNAATGEGASYLAHLLGQTGGGAAAGAAVTEPDEERNLFGLLPNGKFGGALEGALGNLIAMGAPKVVSSVPGIVNKFRPGKAGQELLENLAPGARNVEENTAQLTDNIRKAHDGRVAESTIYSDFVKDQAGNGKIYEKYDPLIKMDVDKEKQVIGGMEDLNIGDLFDKFKSNPTFNNAHDLQSELGVMIGQLEKSPHKTIDIANSISRIKSVRDSLKDDMHSYLQKVGDKTGQDLSGMYKRSSDFYRDNVVPYLSSKKLRDINRRGLTHVKNVHQIFESPTDVVNRYTGKTETGPVNKIMQDLPPDTSNRIMFSKLGGHTNADNPKKLADMIVAADQKGFSKYMTPDLKQGLADLLSKQKNLNRFKVGAGIAGLGTAEELIRRAL